MLKQEASIKNEDKESYVSKGGWERRDIKIKEKDLRYIVSVYKVRSCHPRACPGDPDAVPLKKGNHDIGNNGFPIKDFGNDEQKAEFIHRLYI